MNESKEILGLRVDCLSAKEAMMRAMRFMENVPVDTIEILTMDALLSLSGHEARAEKPAAPGLILPGDPEMLDAAGVLDEKKKKEIRNRTFLKMFLKYLQKNRRRVFLLASDEADMDGLTDALERMNRGIVIAGRALAGSAEGGEENVINEINGTDTECIISVLPSPYQEMFIGENRELLNAKLWLGCGAVMKEIREDGAAGRFGRFLQKLMFRHRITRQKKALL